jgi:hypothetical protein
MNKKAALLFFFLFLFLINVNHAQEIKIKVSVNKASVRLNSDASSPIISVVHAGLITHLIKKTGEWYFVELPPNEKGDVIAGYIHQNEVEEIKAEYKISPYSKALTYDDKKAFKVLVENSNPRSVKIGLRGGEKGIDFIAPPGEQGFTVAPPGDYEIYFQHQIEPESLYKGDEFTLEDNGVKITLREQMGGNYNIRKIK